jgi:hypothetical protein
MKPHEFMQTDEGGWGLHLEIANPVQSVLKPTTLSKKVVGVIILI